MPSRRRRLFVLFATVMSASFCAGCLIFYFVFWPQQLVRNSALLAYTLEQGFEAYRSDHEALPEGTPAQMVEALLGDNPRQKSYVRPEMRDFVSEAGEVRDSWKRPFQFDREDPTVIRLLSAGPNGVFGDDDDVTSGDTLDALLR